MNINAQQEILNANLSNNSSLTSGNSKFDFEMRESLLISKLKFKTYP